MDTDDLLRRAGARWRDTHTGQLVPPDVEAMGHPRRRRRDGAVMALTAAGVALIVVVTLTVLRLGSASPTPGAPAPTGPSTANGPAPLTTSTPTPTPAPTPTPTRPAACTAGQLRGSVGEAGPAHGAENVIILLHNMSDTPCWLGGLLPLFGVTPGGVAQALRFQASTDPAYADPGPVTGPGSVPASGYGAFLVTVDLNCSAVTGRYSTLRIQLAPGQLVELPYPQQFTLGCPGNQAPAGPVPGPTGLLGQ
jgi:hypothetical protein